MVKEDVYITVPSVFRCPISLDVMKSPVSLCTGVTYDRSSIQQWLESGHDTCPATMQVLPSKDFIPNLTLHRLINLWIQSSTLRPGANSPRLLSATSPAISEVRAKLLKEKIESQSCVESLSEVAEFVSYCEENQISVVRFDGFVEAVAIVLRRKCVEIKALEMAVGILNLILGENGVKERLNKLILKSNQEKSSTHRSYTRPPPPPPNNNDQFLNDVVTSILTTVSVTRSIKSRLIENGIVEILSNSSITEKSLKLLASSSSEGRSAISSNTKCAAAVVEKLLKVSRTATEDAVVVLWSGCCLQKEERVKEAVVKGNGVTKIVVIMQREGEGRVKMMCRDLVKSVRGVCKDWSLGCYETKTTHIRLC
ncbi:putative Inflorescence deficient in abscission-like 2 [Hibiscus syriacus]|uniref:U-box domain-containing protein n=1 Tax=Hibiscus syriacus TaxID=106335 RepID=A0A6A2YVK7_HIBSY|nr:putative Inflorescence deficient in abscission-like 2 [Hibiscus syriacus]